MGIQNKLGHKIISQDRSCSYETGVVLGFSTGPDSVMVRAFASEAGGAGSNPGRVIPKTLKMVPVATLLGAQH